MSKRKIVSLVDKYSFKDAYNLVSSEYDIINLTKETIGNIKLDSKVHMFLFQYSCFNCDSSICKKELDGFVLQCKNKSIPVVLTLDAVYYSLSFAYNLFIDSADYILCANVLQKQELLRKGMMEESIIITGDSWLDRFKSREEREIIFSRDQFCKAIGNKESLEIVTIMFDNFYSDCEEINSLVNYFNSKNIFVYLRDTYGEIEDNIEVSQLGTGDKVFIDSPNLVGEYVVPEVDFLEYSKAVTSDTLEGTLVGVLSNNLTSNFSLDKADEDVNEFNSKVGLLDISTLVDKHKFLTETKSYTERQINYVLTKYLPGTFDGRNSVRIGKAISYVASAQALKRRYAKKLSDNFFKTNPELNDPLWEKKLEAMQVLNNGG